MKIRPHFPEKGRFRTFVLGLAVLFLLDWIVLDLWQVRGVVVDDSTATPIDAAWLLANFHGEEPLLVFPFSVHPPSRIGVCMGSRVTRSSQSGRFRYSTLAFNRALANKRVSIRAFKPGWSPARERSAVSSSLLGWSPKVQITMRQSDGPRREAKWYPKIAERLPAHELTYSLELSETLDILSLEICGQQSSEFLFQVMNHAIAIAETFTERNHVVAQCGQVRNRSKDSRRGSANQSAFMVKPVLKNWPFDCENLPFKKQPSAETLAVEAEIAAQRRK